MEKTEVDGGTKPKKRNTQLAVGVIVGLFVAIVVGYVAWTWNNETTDDAQVDADVATLSARTGGLILKVMVSENSQVKAGDVIMQLDEAERAAFLKQAEAELATSKAQLETAQAQCRIVEASAKGGLQSAQASYAGSSVQVASAHAAIEAAQAGVDHGKSQLHQAEIDLKRAEKLREANAIPQDRLDSAQTAFDQARAGLAQAQAQLTSALESKKAAQSRVIEAQGRLDQSRPVDAQIAAARAAVDLAQASVQAAEARLDTQRLLFSYLKVRAPIDGVVSRISAHDGQLLQTGQPVAEMVPLKTYVTANFKETQLEKMQPGQNVKISVDTYEHRSFEGVVESLSAGTGAKFALLPPDNASGNFVKVVQRVPVRIAWKNLPSDVQMRAGLSVTVTVNTGS